MPEAKEAAKETFNAMIREHILNAVSVEKIAREIDDAMGFEEFDLEAAEKAALERMRKLYPDWTDKQRNDIVRIKLIERARKSLDKIKDEEEKK